jgi:hypothetical protein
LYTQEFLISSQVVQSIVLTKVCVNRRAVEAVQGARVAELEDNNAKLLVELEQTRLALAEANAARKTLFMEHGKLEEECACLCVAIDTPRQEKADAMAARKAEITTVRNKFQDYRLHHRKKLRELRVNLENAMNEIGVRCLPYPRKNSRISKVITWFDKEIQALPGAIAKANKNFLVSIMRCFHLG